MKTTSSSLRTGPRQRAEALFAAIRRPEANIDIEFSTTDASARAAADIAALNIRVRTGLTRAGDHPAPGLG